MVAVTKVASQRFRVSFQRVIENLWLTGASCVRMGGMHLANVLQCHPKCTLDFGSNAFEAHLPWPAQRLSATLHRAATEFYRLSAILAREFLISEMRKTPAGPEGETTSRR